MIYVLTFVIIVLVALIGFTDYNNRKERKALLNAILSFKGDEVVNRMTSLELTDKTEVKVNNQEQPDYTELSDVSDDEFNELVTGDKN
jgi:hypothetical protein